MAEKVETAFIDRGKPWQKRLQRERQRWVRRPSHGCSSSAFRFFRASISRSVAVSSGFRPGSSGASPITAVRDELRAPHGQVGALDAFSAHQGLERAALTAR